MSDRMRRALIVGQGSIGQRHARLLRMSGRIVEVVSAHAPGAFGSIADALKQREYDEAIIASVTSRHLDVVHALSTGGFRGDLLVEKPLTASLVESLELASLCYSFRSAFVGYNLRYHPVIQALRGALEGETIVEARLSVGQFLPDWRPDTDYKSTSSARAKAGGGALRDLSHEIDLLLHLFGPWTRVVSLGGNLGRLGIETDEAWTILFEMCSGAQISLTLNYFDQPPQRGIVVTTRSKTLRADLIRSHLAINNDHEQSFYAERDDTYRALHQAIVDGSDVICTISEGVEVMRTIDAIERSNSTKAWVHS